MRYLILVLIVSFALIGSAAGSLNEEPKNGDWLLGRLQKLADTGALFDPQAVQRLLSLDGQFTAQAGQPPADHCANPYGSTTNSVATNELPAWLKSTSEGVQNMQIPAFAINPAGVSGPPTFVYTLLKHTACNSDFVLAHTQDATISIGLPAFVCYRENDLRSRLPGAERQMATDGVYFVEYHGQRREEDATDLQFIFRFGAPCALDVEVRQSTLSGFRYQRAYANWRTCRKQADRRYCDENRTMTWSEGDQIDLMDRAAVRSCGGITKFYADEAGKTGGPPPPAPRVHSGTPCDQ